MTGLLAVLAGAAAALWTRWLVGLLHDRRQLRRWRSASGVRVRPARQALPAPAWLRLCYVLPPVPSPLAMAVEPLATALARAGLGQREEAEALARRLPSLGLAAAAGWFALTAALGAVSLPGLIPSVLAVAVLAPVAARHAIDRAARRRQAGLLAELPVFVDLLVLGLEGGLNVRQTLALVARYAPSSWQALVVAAVQQVEHGLPLARAVAGLRAHVAPGPGRTVLRALAVAERAGVGPVPLLRRQAEYAQQLLERRWHARVGALPVQLMLVGLLLLFPPVLVVLLLPSVLTFLQSRW